MPHGSFPADMDGSGGNNLLLRRIESPQFTVFQCVSHIVRYSGNVGIVWKLCERLRSYPDGEVTFYLPQLVHVFVTVETDSAALENYLVELCSRSPHCTLLVFWQLQASITDLADLPKTYGFGVAKRLYNKLQELLFSSLPPDQGSMRENASPALVLASMILGALVPQVGQAIKPLLTAQGRRQRTFLLKRATTPLETDADDADNDTEEQNPEVHAMAKSLPNLHVTDPVVPKRRSSTDIDRISSHRQLVMNYFKCETQFVYSLQTIANKLVSVPKQARLSALQLELALLNRDLPAEVDIPWLLNFPAEGRQHRIVRISPSEATVLNSAEKTPFLLLVEYLKDDVSFDPTTERNRYILRTPDERKYLFERNFKEAPQPPHTPTIESELPLVEKDMSGYSINDIEEFKSSPRSSSRSIKFLSQADIEGDQDEEPTQSTGDEIQQLVVQMRTASLIIAQLDGADGAKLPKSEIASIKAKIIDNMQAMQDHDILVSGEAGDRKLENDLKVSGLGANDDPSAANLGEDWNSRKERIRRSSPYGSYPNWDLFSVIIKTGDDLRQEALASQLIQWAQKMWSESNVDVWVKKMGILVTSSSSGLVETITNGLSIHSIKKALANKNGVVPRTSGDSVERVPHLTQYFEEKFGARGTRSHTRALRNFIKSLAAYSLLCYILQIKDRHNGNILLDNEGHIIHIDFGFMLSNSPGGHFQFEAAPFKLTHEYVELMGGADSELYKEFVKLMQEAFCTLRTNAEEFIRMVEVMSVQSRLPCFQGGVSTALQLRQRFHLHLSSEEADAYVEKTLIFKSYGSVYTRLYDQFQMVTQGIYS